MKFPDIKQKLSNKCVGIAGAGGLGSNAAVALARVGIGKLIIADFDKVEESNLNRQYYFTDQVGQPKVDMLKENIIRIQPDIKIIIHNITLNSFNLMSIFRECDLVIEAFDKAEMKKMLIESFNTEMPHMKLIIGSGMAGYGKTDSIHTRQMGNLYICGDEESEISDDNPPLAPRVGIVANMQANLALEILLNE